MPEDYDLGYWFHRPDGLTEPMPLVLFLHGAGERGDDLELVRVHGPTKQAYEGQELPFALLAPQCPADSWWHWHERDVMALLDRIMETQPVDPDRVYLTGLSMGGFGTWDLAARHPDRFAAAVPICGWGDGWLVGRLVGLPIWAFHNEDDPVVEVSGTTRLAEQLRNAGGTIKATINPTGGHDAWTAAYDDPALYEWMLAQRRR